MCLQSSNQLVVVVVVVLVFGARGLGEVAGVFFVLEEDGGAAGVAEVVLAGLWSQLGCSVRVVMFSNLNPPFNLHTPPDLGGLLLFFMAVPWRMAFNELGCQNVQMTSVDYCCVSSLRLTIFSHHRGQVSLLVTFF